jgi:hypothetical protein
MKIIIRNKQRMISKPLKKKSAASKVETLRMRNVQVGTFNQGFDTGHDQGYNQGYDKGYQVGFGDGQANQAENGGYNKGYDKGYDEAYKKGVYAGGDAIVDSLLPFDCILPEVSIGQIIKAGMERFRSQYFTLLSTAQVVQQLRSALDSRTPFSLIRVGDGEALTLAQEVAMSTDQVLKEGQFLSYAGVDIPDLKARDQLATAIRLATVVGIPKPRSSTYQPLVMQAFSAHGIDYRNLQLTHSLVNYLIYHDGYLAGLLRGRRVLVVGNLGVPLAERLTAHGIAVVGTILPVNGIKDVSRVMNEIAAYDFDIALISAGIAAVILTQRISSEMGKVAIDFGHLANSIASGETPMK